MAQLPPTRRTLGPCLEALAAACEDAIIAWDTTGACILWNGAAERLTGRTPAESVGAAVREIIPTDDPSRIDACVAASLRGESVLPTEREFRLPHGGNSMLRARCSPLRDPSGTIIGGIAVLHDLTPELSAETERAARATSDATRRAVFDAALDAIVIVDSEGRYIDVNPAACQLLGRARTDVVGQRVGAFAAPGHDGEATFRSAIAAAAGRGAHRIVRPDGTVRDVEFEARANFLPGLHLGVFRDVTERLQAAEAVRRSEDRYRAFFEGTPSGACITRPDGTIVACNPAFARMFGLPSAAEAAGTDAKRLYADPAARVALLEDVRRDGAVVARPVELRCVNGTARHGLLNVSAVRDEHGEVVRLLSHVLDVTEARVLEERLRQAQKLEALGRLAGGVAHDFNNLLTAITGYSELVLRTLEPSDPRHGWCCEVLATAERAASLTRQLLAFSRRQPVEPKVLDLGEAVASLERMLLRVAGEGVKVRFVRDAGPHRIRADRTQVDQVLLNLTVNACDAMPNGGCLVIGVRALILPEAPGRWIELSARDDGVGMTPETADRIFEPFFTTKEHGTGLGLSTVYGIVEQSGGRISVETAPGRGTTFRILFPATTSDVARSATSDEDTGPTSGNGTVLVVEDDPAVREMAVHALAGFGYTAVGAESGDEALGVLASDRPIDLLLADVVMPVMGGRELAARARALRPRLPVLFMSGYAEDAMLRTNLLESSSAFLAKPFTPTALARKVAETMAADDDADSIS